MWSQVRDRKAVTELCSNALYTCIEKIIQFAFVQRFNSIFIILSHCHRVFLAPLSFLSLFFFNFITFSFNSSHLNHFHRRLSSSLLAPQHGAVPALSVSNVYNLLLLLLFHFSVKQYRVLAFGVAHTNACAAKVSTFPIRSHRKSILMAAH